MGLRNINARTILDAARLNAEMADSERLDDVTGLMWVNGALAEIHDLLVGAYEDYFLCRVEIPAGKLEVQLPDDFFKLLKLYSVDTGLPVPRFTLHGRLAGTVTPSADVVRYRILGNSLIFTSAPGTTLEMWYAPQFRPLMDLADEVHISVPVAWAELAIADVTARALAQEESDPSFWIAKANEIRKRIVEMAAERDAGESHRIVDIYGYRDDLEG